MLHGDAQLGFEFEVGQHEVNAEGDPNLGQHRVARGAEKSLDFQILLDPFEEQFDLPAFFVDFGDLAGFEVMGVGDESIIDAGFRVRVGNQAQRLFDSIEPDGLIVGDAGAFPPSPFEHILDIGVCFQTGDKEDGVGGQIAVPAVIGEAAIHADKGTLGEFQCSGPVDLMVLASGHVHEGRKIPVGVQTDMQFDGSFFLPEFSPGKGGKTEIDHRGIKQVEFALK